MSPHAENLGKIAVNVYGWRSGDRIVKECVRKSLDRILSSCSSKLALMCLAIAFGSIHFDICLASEIWLSGVDPIVRQKAFHLPPSDYIAMFKDDISWSRAARSVDYFKTSTQFLQGGSDEDLRAMIQGLNRRNIKLAVEGLMSVRRSSCGVGVEGYSDPGLMSSISRRVRSLGGTIDAVAMDEPAWFGHHYQGKSACRLSLKEVAEAVSENVKAIRAIFPQAKIGDVEPVGGRVIGWNQELGAFISAYELASGSKLDFFDADLDWSAPYRRDLQEISKIVRDAGIPFGVIYNGDVEELSDRAWTDHATARFEEIEGELGLKPDRAILQSWTAQPDHMLPESEIGTMTNLVLSYERLPVKLLARMERNKVEGLLTLIDGTPLRSETVSLRATSLSPPLTQVEINGVVPAGVHSALVGFRINNECNCDGRVNVAAGPFLYLSGKQRVKSGVVFAKSPWDSMAKGVIRLAAANGQKEIINSEQFSVTSNEPYSLVFPQSVSANTSDSGYIAIIFLDSSGREKARKVQLFRPTEFFLAQTTTDLEGHFQIDTTRFANLIPASYKISFTESVGEKDQGELRFRSVSKTLP